MIPFLSLIDVLVALVVVAGLSLLGLALLLVARAGHASRAETLAPAPQAARVEAAVGDRESLALPA